MSKYEYKYFERSNIICVQMSRLMLCKYINIRTSNLVIFQQIEKYFYIHFIIEGFMLVFLKTLRHHFVITIKKSIVYVALNSRTFFNHIHICGPRTTAGP